MPDTIGTAQVQITPQLQGFEQALMGGLSGPLKNAEGLFANLGKAAVLGIGAIGVAATGVGVVAVKLAADFQTVTTTLVTGAGESAKNIDLIRQGLLKLAPEVGVAPVELAKGLYNIESAGFHGAAALDILKISAEGAKVGMADQAVVADAVTTALNAYHLGAGSAAAVTNDLIATVALGKTHMQDLASSMGAILPVASAFHVSFAEISGAMATMTVQGTDASRASQSLRFLLSALAGPTAAAAKEMKGLGIGEAEIPGITAGMSKSLQDLGLHTSEVSAVLGQQGLAGALKLITDALAKQFPLYQTNTAQAAAYESALKGAVGGTRGMTAALELTGANMAVFSSNVADITGKVTAAGGAVAGWDLIQSNFNEKLAKFKATIDVLLIQIGNFLLPVLTQFADWMTKDAIPAVVDFGTKVYHWFVEVGIPAIKQFGQWMYDNVITPLIHIAQVVGPPLIAILGGLRDAFMWIATNLNGLFLPALIAFGAVWAGLKIEGMISSVLQLGASFATASSGLSAMGMLFSPLAIGLVAAAILALAMNWDKVTTAVHDFFVPADAVKHELQTLDDEAAKHVFSSLASDAQGFTDALSQTALYIDGQFTTALDNLDSKLTTNAQTIATWQGQMSGKSDPLGTLQGVTQSASASGNAAEQGLGGFVNTLLGAVIPGFDTGAAKAKAFNDAMSSVDVTAHNLAGVFTILPPVVQATLNSLARGGATVDEMTKTFTALKDVQQVGLPVWQATGQITGIVGQASDVYRQRLALLAGDMKNPLHNAFSLMLGDYDKAGGAIGLQSRAILAALPLYDTLVRSYTEQATKLGLTGQAAIDWATQQAGKIDPAGANANKIVNAMAVQYGLTYQQMESVIGLNPALMQAYLDQQNAAASLKSALQNEWGWWNSLTGAMQASIVAHQAYVHELATNPAPSSGGHGVGTYAEGGVSSFGSGTLVTLHGTEAIIPKDKAGFLWPLILGAIANGPPKLPGMAGGGVVGSPSAQGDALAQTQVVAANSVLETTLAGMISVATQNHDLSMLQKAIALAAYDRLPHMVDVLKQVAVDWQTVPGNTGGAPGSVPQPYSGIDYSSWSPYANQVAAAYKQYLGREVDMPGLFYWDVQAANYGMPAVARALANSPEGMAYAKAHPTQGPVSAQNVASLWTQIMAGSLAMETVASPNSAYFSLGQSMGLFGYNPQAAGGMQISPNVTNAAQLSSVMANYGATNPGLGSLLGSSGKLPTNMPKLSSGGGSGACNCPPSVIQNNTVHNNTGTPQELEQIMAQSHLKLVNALRAH